MLRLVWEILISESMTSWISFLLRVLVTVNLCSIVLGMVILHWTQVKSCDKPV